MTYTTDDYKNVLISQYQAKKSDWKRTKKYKDANESVYRDFFNSVTKKLLLLKVNLKMLFVNSQSFLLKSA